MSESVQLTLFANCIYWSSHDSVGVIQTWCLQMFSFHQGLVGGDQVPALPLLMWRWSGMCLDTWYFTMREMESSTLEVPSSHYLLRPWVCTLGTNFLDSVTPTYITQESPQDQHVTSPWHSLMFISLSALLVMIQEELSSQHSLILSQVQQQHSFFTGETIEKDSQLRLEEQRTIYIHALLFYMQPHQPSVLLRPVKGFFVPHPISFHRPHPHSFTQKCPKEMDLLAIFWG